MHLPRHHVWILLPMLALAGCNQAATTASRPAADASPELIGAASNVATAVTRAPAPRPAARSTVAQLDTTTAEQRAAAARPAQSAETRLGTTVASLGDATRSGFWIRTPLVKEPAMGRLRNPANGKSAQVELLPLDGPASAGSQVSLPALQLLGVSLTALPTLEVFKS
ncbi:hypothetical protein SAMN04489859_1001191 [Paracoccus alcaliphilus]|uniref:D-galactarate dehydratase / Altronate hydrolase, C terminus n=1 Tax=Paracoccus alcaliphilus TaxID=34002 RepID=A0A1H8E5W7_9RHOB|nr:hypothetical protein [Paracoccus alcaliphilus]WCR16774.1 hypothetical protein JHW40_10080 [Paracoccus alcaliphilus]SEN14514.1 hypothetical protein SAMN04489859_1001191 [Paracoccus alcaliphilus]